MADQSYENILVDQDDKVMTLTLNRPDQMNALSRGLVDEMHDALHKAELDDSIRAVVLTGSGRAFSAGYDLGDEPEPSADGEPAAGRRADFLRNTWQRLAVPSKHLELMRLGVPVIAAINGWCLGGGLWYALACDITIASDQAVFGQPEVREAYDSTFLLAAIAGWKVAHRWALTGDHFDAHEAARVGVVNEVVPHEELMEKATALARRIALLPADSVRLNKAITTYGLEVMGLDAALRTTEIVSILVHSSRDTTDLDEMNRIRQEEGMRPSLIFRDNPFIPEPGGPRSKVRS